MVDKITVSCVGDRLDGCTVLMAHRSHIHFWDLPVASQGEAIQQKRMEFWRYMVESVSASQAFGSRTERSKIARQRALEDMGFKQKNDA